MADTLTEAEIDQLAVDITTDPERCDDALSQLVAQAKQAARATHGPTPTQMSGPDETQK